MKSFLKPLIACLLIMISCLAHAKPAIHTFILLRHAERTPQDGLTIKGKQRAQRLAALFAKAPIAKVYSTNFNRTRETIRPLAKAKHLPITLYERESALIDELNRDMQLQSPQTIIIVGHSNTLAPLIYALGGPSLADIDESDFGNLYVLSKSGQTTHFLPLRY